MANYESLLLDATRLPVTERIQLIEALRDTVPEDCLPPLSDEWAASAERRSAGHDSGSVVTVPWDTIRADALARHATRTPR
ncbi:MAG: addiction module protein [Thermodesulfobacteriota bacterium]